MVTHPARAKDLFLAAVEIGSLERRSAFLHEACAGDQELWCRVHALLDAHDRPESLLDKAAAAVRAPFADIDETSGVPLVAEQIGTIIGPYKLMEQIGEGGMGVVYVAEQTQPVRRKVALKIIKPGMDTKQVIARFEAERQALAMMDHPNIARVHDGGATPEGRLYFVMELVRGIPITDYCDREQLSIPDRLELFVLVCRAVQHAHQKGIIHRDLKPSNILVTVIDAAAVPKVIDFGVAKATGASLTDRTIYTAFHQFVGTPLYVSPEQADLSGMDIDTRSDIYSLGVLLYELLTGTTPFDQETFRTAAFDEVRRIIREQEPPKPSTRLSSLGAARTTISANRKAGARHLDRSIRGDLDWIVMKSLEKDRRRRYETANDFAADVMRYLTEKPVEACPPSASYRFSKFARRNRSALITSGVVALSLMAGTIISTWQAIAAVRARRDSSKSLATARRAVDEMYTEVAEDWLNQQPSLTSVQQRFLEKALTLYEQFAANPDSGLVARIDAARARIRVAKIEQKLGKLDLAQASFRQTIQGLADLSAQYPDDEKCRELLASTRTKLGVIQVMSGNIREAQSLYRQSIATHEDLVARNPGEDDYRNALATATYRLALTYENTGRYPEAEYGFRRARAMWDALHAKLPRNTQITTDLAWAEDMVGFILKLTHARPEEAQLAMRRSLRLREELVTAEPKNPEHRFDVAIAMNNLNAHLSDHSQETLDRSLRSIAILGKLTEEFPDRPSYRGVLVVTRSNHAFDLYSLGRIEDAEASARPAVAMAERLVADYPDQPDHRAKLANSLGVMAFILSDSDKRDEAEALFRRENSISEQLIVDFPERADYRISAAAVAADRGSMLLEQVPLRALALLRRAVELDPTSQLAWKYLGAAEYRNGHWDAAIKASEKCIEVRGDNGWGYQWLVLGLAHAQRGEMVKAREWFAKAWPDVLGGVMRGEVDWLIHEASALLPTEPRTTEAQSKAATEPTQPRG